MNNSIKLTVFFEEPFWVGIFERSCEEKYDVLKIVFGPEPKDYQVYEFILKNFHKLRFSNSIPNIRTNDIKEKKINPKRLKRKIKKETKSTEIGTKAQLVMKLQYEVTKVERKKISREKKEEEEKRKFQLKQQKKLMKRKGH